MFKQTLFLIAGLAVAIDARQASKKITGGDVISIFAGVMNGIVHEDHLDYLLGCMNGTEALVADVESAVADFESGGFWGITEGILEIKQFIADLPPTISNCGGIPDDFAKLGKFFSIFGNFTLLEERVTYNMLWYYSDVYNDVGQALTYWNQGDYFDFGDKLGDALVMACGDHSSGLPFDNRRDTTRTEFTFNQ